ncbi:rhodanese-like domain-containing protein [Pseudoalteromonas spongiae]|jgi:rhodanese-related sulfurtransferase|uniref:rhodanese-like domain-containing protein n=1 Tax=Pseudoalteromonas spongiae TaxID=298657 RepID=UPI000C2D33F2|nr:rhodanese-like domain-containing protein [Pseudoalteromonas spongiae]TMO85339.1 thiosulfate sulfurtransferase GlpE [Pseudoalteromonas spongiae]|tara:strand:+ start:368 stop:799 length:432 start_codon:yes stop_codon:yes gene_type:complete
MAQFVEFVTNNLILCLIWVGLLGAIVLGWFKSRFSAVKQVNPQQLTHLVNRENGLVVDIRALKDFNQGHIAGSVHLAAEKAKQGEFVGLEKSKNDPIILVCVSGMTAQSIANGLVKAGYEQVNVLSGGITAWQNANLPLTTGK